MARETGTHQVVVQGITDSLSYRLMDKDGALVTISTVTAKIYKPSGVEVTHGATPTSSGAVATISLSWIAATYPVGTGWKIVWTLNGIKCPAYFDVVLRDFSSQLADTDITAAHPGLTLPSGVSTWAEYRLRAWERIRFLVQRSLRKDPALIFNPERFFETHLAWSLAEYFRANAFSGSQEDWTKFQEYDREGLVFLKAVLADLDYDADGDGLMGTGDTGHNVLPWLDREFM